MLVLSRKSRESVVVGGSGEFQRLLKVTVLGIKGATVKLGFEVDADIPVHRSEVWDRIKADGRAGRKAEGHAKPLALRPVLAQYRRPWPRRAT
jgi:carbon storage regulator CsrA